MSAVVLGAGLVLTACSSSPVKFGSAAIVGDQRITMATLDTEVNNLSQAVERNKGTVQLSQEQQTQQTLTWLVRFKVQEELARQAGITVSKAQAEQALASIYAAAKSSAEAQGIPNATPRPHPGRQRDPAEPGRRGRPLPGHRRRVRQAGQRRAGAHQHGGADGRLGQAHQGTLRGGQGPEYPDQPAVRRAELRPARGRLRARHGVPDRPARRRRPLPRG